MTHGCVLNRPAMSVSSSMTTDFVRDALEQALYARQPGSDGTLIHHSDGGSQYVSIRYSVRLAEANIEPSVGSRGDSYDNALAETINGLYKAELHDSRGGSNCSSLQHRPRHVLPRLHLQNRIPLIQQMLPKNRAQLLPIARLERLQHLIVIMNRAIPLGDLKIRPKP